MILRKKMRKQTKIFKKAINAKWAFYWAKFMTESAEICERYRNNASCEKCPFNVNDFGEYRIRGCILSGPDTWDDPKAIGYIVRTIIHEMAGGKKC